MKKSSIFFSIQSWTPFCSFVGAMNVTISYTNKTVKARTWIEWQCFWEIRCGKTKVKERKNKRWPFEFFSSVPIFINIFYQYIMSCRHLPLYTYTQFGMRTIIFDGSGFVGCCQFTVNELSIKVTYKWNSHSVHCNHHHRHYFNVITFLKMFSCSIFISPAQSHQNIRVSTWQKAKVFVFIPTNWWTFYEFPSFGLNASSSLLQECACVGAMDSLSACNLQVHYYKKKLIW